MEWKEIENSEEQSERLIVKEVLAPERYKCLCGYGSVNLAGNGYAVHTSDLFRQDPEHKKSTALNFKEKGTVQILRNNNKNKTAWKPDTTCGLSGKCVYRRHVQERKNQPKACSQCRRTYGKRVMLLTIGFSMHSKLITPRDVMGQSRFT